MSGQERLKALQQDGPGGLPQAQDPAAFARALMQAQQAQPQRMQCAVCIGSQKAWELQHQAELAPAIEVIKQAAAAGAQPPPLGALVPAELLATMPQVLEAITMATLPNSGGPALVCGQHAPVWTDGPAAGGLLVANAGMDVPTMMRMGLLG